MSAEKTRPPDLLALARRIVWFEEPEAALRDRNRFLAYLMTFCTPEDLAVAARHFSPEDFREAVLNAPPGIFDERSWVYWNLKFGRSPAPPMPVRTIP